MEMYNPAHPGEILKYDYLPGYNLTISAFALRIGVSRNTVSDILNGHAGISTEMALRLEKVFNVSAEFWLNLQQQYDLWQTRNRTNFDDIEPIAL